MRRSSTKRQIYPVNVTR